MRVLIFGSSGQLGQALRSTAIRDIEVIYASHRDCDISNRQAVIKLMDTVEPDFVINCAAYTSVDRAEEEVEYCYRINALAPQIIAKCCSRVQTRRLIHISTDFVFDGSKNTPYNEEDTPNPANVYGASKLMGENKILSEIPDQAMIIRTAWVYHAIGSNFVNTMLRLMSQRNELNIVNDQKGSPTFARSLAQLIWDLIHRSIFLPGIYHWTDAGEITWYEFAESIYEEATRYGILSQPVVINPITTSEYPTPAIRPPYSVLGGEKMERLINRKRSFWRDNLQLFCEELRQ